MKSMSLVLDAMGVIYESANDVIDLLCPFIEEKGGLSDCEKVHKLYKTASLGMIETTDFWGAVGLSKNVEDDYLSRFKLSENVELLFDSMRNNNIKVYYLSNDISKWAYKLQDKFGLKNHITGSMISGDAGSRKPDVEIYEKLINVYKLNPKECVFVDDRPANLNTAKAIGMKTIQYTEHFIDGKSNHKKAKNMNELLKILKEMRNEEIGS